MSYRRDIHGKLTHLRKSWGDYQTITYDGLGRKTSTSFTEVRTGATDRRDYYASGLIMHGDSVEMILFGGGYFDSSLKPHYYATDYQGNNTGVFDSRGYAVQRTEYYPYGEPLSRPTATYGSSANRFLFGGKEYSNAFGEAQYDQEARTYIPIVPFFSTMDPLCHEMPWISPISFCAGNPIMYVDPTGNDWYSCIEMIYDIERNEYDFVEKIKYSEVQSEKDLLPQDKSGVIEINQRYLGKVVVVMDGYYDERLSVDNKLKGEGAKSAQVTVYGPKGADDIGQYTGFSMTSDFKKYGAIANGEYDVNYDLVGKSGAIPSHYVINNRGNVPTIDGNRVPKSEGGASEDMKDGIFIHRTNLDGSANGRVSIGCILIDAADWPSFEGQIGQQGFKFILNRI